jgi:hypothetical protein
VIRTTKNICLIASLVISNSAYACFGGYFAPGFLELTDPIIGVGVSVIFVAVALNYKRKLGILTFTIPIVFLLVSYFGHFNYSGDCGREIVLMNKIAMFISILWLLYELGMYYGYRSKEKT